MPRSKCKNCYGKGYASVMESVHGSGDFVGEQSFTTTPKVYRHYCTCRKGQRMKQEAVNAGKKQVLFNLFDE